MEGKLQEPSGTIGNSAFTMRESRLWTSGSQDKKEKASVWGRFVKETKPTCVPSSDSSWVKATKRTI